MIRLDMMIAWHGNIFCITGPLWGESTGHRWIPLTKGQWYRKRPIIRNCIVFFAVSLLNNLLNKQFSCWWSEIQWHLCDITVMIYHEHFSLISTHFFHFNCVYHALPRDEITPSRWCIQLHCHHVYRCYTKMLKLIITGYMIQYIYAPKTVCI